MINSVLSPLKMEHYLFPGTGIHTYLRRLYHGLSVQHTCEGYPLAYLWGDNGDCYARLLVRWQRTLLRPPTCEGCHSDCYARLPVKVVTETATPAYLWRLSQRLLRPPTCEGCHGDCNAGMSHGLPESLSQAHGGGACLQGVVGLPGIYKKKKWIFLIFSLLYFLESVYFWG